MMETKNRNIDIDVIKGLGIILMVLGHAYPAFRDWIYLFHMALFFLASGYCFNESKTGSFKDYKNYCIKKLKSLYLPYVLINILFLLLDNVFLDMGLFSTDAEFVLMQPNALYPQNVHEIYSFSTAIQALIRSLLLVGGTSHFSGATWFLASLFWVTIVHGFVVCIRKSNHWLAKISDWKENCFIVCFLCVVIWLFLYFDIDFPLSKIILRDLICYLAYLLGTIVSRLDRNTNISGGGHLHSNSFWLNHYTPIYGVVSFILLCILNMCGKIEVSACEITNPLYFVICTLLGWQMMMSFSKVLHGRIKKFFAYIGRNTMCILCFHLLAFRIVSYGYILLEHADIRLIASYPVVFNLEWYWILAYTIVGVSVPLMINIPYGKIKQKLMNRAA